MKTILNQLFFWTVLSALASAVPVVREAKSAAKYQNPYCNATMINEKKYNLHKFVTFEGNVIKTLLIELDADISRGNCNIEEKINISVNSPGADTYQTLADRYQELDNAMIYYDELLLDYYVSENTDYDDDVMKKLNNLGIRLREFKGLLLNIVSNKFDFNYIYVYNMHTI